MYKELWGYISRAIPQPKVLSIPKEPTPLEGASMLTKAQKDAYEDEIWTFNEVNKDFINWNKDKKAVGSMQLRMADKLGYLIRDTETSLQINKFNETWIIDSGASHHITSKLTDFTNYTPYLELK